ncbi:MAG: DUF11 domain-containing protein, partial [Thermoplasmata archaeon]|nr:DUF11 domain-containing protein [Thermoplasmata archaeon]
VVFVDYENLVNTSWPTVWAFANTTIIDPLLEVEKTAPPTANTGDTITYTITVTNVGTDTAYDVWLNETYPPGVTFVNAVPQPDNLGAGNDTWYLGNLTPGTSITITITLLVNATGGWLNNTAYADYHNSVRPLPTVWDNASTQVINPSMNVTKWAPATANTGEVITYWINYTNTGDDWAYNVVITETYPFGVTYIISNPLPDVPTDNVWTILQVAPGGSGSIEITVQIEPWASGWLNNSVTLEFENEAGLPQLIINATAGTLITDPLMIITKTAPEFATINETIMYTITYQNIGTDDAYNVVITENYPPGVNFVDANPTPTVPNSIWIIPVVPAGTGGTIFINVTIDANATGVLINNVTLEWEDQAGQIGPTLWVETVTVISGPYVLVEKTAPPLANPGETIMYIITYQNIGNETAYNVWINETYPPFVTFVDANPPPTVGNNAWFIGDLVPGASGAIYINVTIDLNATGNLTNFATAEYQNVA